MNPPFSAGLPPGWGFGRSTRSVWIGDAPELELRIRAAFDGLRDSLASFRRPRFSLRSQRAQPHGWGQEPGFIPPPQLSRTATKPHGRGAAPAFVRSPMLARRVTPTLRFQRPLLLKFDD